MERTEMKCKVCGGFSSAQICWPCSQISPRLNAEYERGRSEGLKEGLRRAVKIAEDMYIKSMKTQPAQETRKGELEQYRMFVLAALRSEISEEAK